MTLQDTNGHSNSNNVLPLLPHVGALKLAKEGPQAKKSNPTAPKVIDDGRPTVDIKKPMNEVVDLAIDVLADDATLFNLQGELTQVQAEEGGRIKTRPVKSVQARYLLAQGAIWVSGNDKIHPPDHIAKCVVERTTWERIRTLRAVTPFPAIDPEGRMRTEPGYDETTRTYFTGGVKIEVLERPTKEDAERAVADLLDIVQDFPFAKNDKEHQAAWIAGLLTPLARYAHDGNAPLTIVQANCARAGKTTLVQLISKIVTGFDSPVVTFTKNEDETRKRIFTFLRSPRSLVLVDNVVGQFGGANINAMLTTRGFEDRILGQSKYLEVKADASWFVTGNNMTLAPDTAERCLHVRLQSDQEKPHERTGFTYPYLFETVKERRGKLLSAALTILKAFIVAGKPDQGLPSWGGFETWSQLVRGAVVHGGLPDPAITRAELEQEADVEADSMSELVAALWAWQQDSQVTGPYAAADSLDSLHAHPDRFVELRRAFVNLAAMPGGALPSIRVLGRHLREAKNRTLGGFVLRSEKKHAANLYRVERLEPVSKVHPEPGD